MSNYNKPYTFRAGNYAKAKEVNANFDTLQDYVNDLGQTLSTVEIESTPYNKANVNGNSEIQFSVANATSADQAVNKGQLDGAVSGLQTSIADTNTTVAGNYTSLSNRITVLEGASCYPDYSSYSTFDSDTGAFPSNGVLWLYNVAYNNYSIKLGNTTFSGLVGSQAYTFPVAIGTTYDLGNAKLYAKFFPNVA